MPPFWPCGQKIKDSGFILMTGCPKQKGGNAGFMDNLINLQKLYYKCWNYVQANFLTYCSFAGDIIWFLWCFILLCGSEYYNLCIQKFFHIDDRNYKIGLHSKLSIETKSRTVKFYICLVPAILWVRNWDADVQRYWLKWIHAFIQLLV